MTQGRCDICDSVKDTVRKEAGEKPLHVEGLLKTATECLVEYSNVVVHIFLKSIEIFTALSRFGPMPTLKR